MGGQDFLQHSWGRWPRQYISLVCTKINDSQQDIYLNNNLILIKLLVQCQLKVVAERRHYRYDLFSNAHRINRVKIRSLYHWAVPDSLVLLTNYRIMSLTYNATLPCRLHDTLRSTMWRMTANYSMNYESLMSTAKYHLDSVALSSHKHYTSSTQKEPSKMFLRRLMWLHQSHLRAYCVVFSAVPVPDVRQRLSLASHI